MSEHSQSAAAMRTAARVLNAATAYHFLAHLWFMGWLSMPSFIAVAIAWILLPLAAACHQRAVERHCHVLETEDDARRADEFLELNDPTHAGHG